MKKYIAFVILIVLGLNSFAQKNEKAKNGLNIELLSFKQSSTNFENYINTVSDSLGVAGMLTASPMQYGIGVSLLLNGFELGADYSKSFSSGKANGAGTTAAKMNLTTFNVRIGPNFSLSKNLLFGCLFMLTSNEVKLDVASTTPAISGRFKASDNENMFRSYFLKGRFQVIFNIPTKGNFFTAVKLIPFYDVAITKHNFYDASDNVLKNYNNEKTSNNNALGVKLAFTLASK
ncbi:MAG: hypothetical protein JSR12_02590 [Bacteroidetes bacterium]|nr:hypothetical protein [Bacteroidota bacterium]